MMGRLLKVSAVVCQVAGYPRHLVAMVMTCRTVHTAKVLSRTIAGALTLKVKKTVGMLDQPVVRGRLYGKRNHLTK
jgi:hypothetical protein